MYIHVKLLCFFIIMQLQKEETAKKELALKLESEQKSRADLDSRVQRLEEQLESHRYLQQQEESNATHYKQLYRQCKAQAQQMEQEKQAMIDRLNEELIKAKKLHVPDRDSLTQALLAANDEATTKAKDLEHMVQENQQRNRQLSGELKAAREEIERLRHAQQMLDGNAHLRDELERIKKELDRVKNRSSSPSGYNRGASDHLQVRAERLERELQQEQEKYAKLKSEMEKMKYANAVSTSSCMYTLYECCMCTHMH